MGRPSGYEKRVKPYLEDIKAALKRNVTEKEIMENLGVSSSSWFEYKNKYSEFAEIFEDKKDYSEILQRLDTALLKAAEGFTYEEIKVYEVIDENGEKKTHKEKMVKYQPPNVTAIFGAYNRFDKDYKKDRAYYELKREELDLKKAIAEASNFDINLDKL